MSIRVLTQGIGGSASASIFVTGLDESSSVSATKDGKTVKGKWAPRPNPACLVPDGYTQLNKIVANGSQVISVPNFEAATDLNYYVRGSVSDTVASTISHFFEIPNSGKNIRTYYHKQYGWYVELLAEREINYSSGIHEFEVKGSGTNREVYLDQVLQGNFTSNLDRLNLLPYISTLYIGAWDETAKDGLDGEIEEIIFYHGANEYMHFIPAKRNSDSVVGVYETVSGVFYPPTIGTFTAGEEIPSTFDGHLIPKIKSYGIWTVTATNGEQAEIQDVLVDAAIEYQIKMSYRLYLYNNGYLNSDLVGTIKIESGGVTVNSNNIYMARTSSGRQGFVFSKAVDLTNMETLTALMDASLVSKPYSSAISLTVCNSATITGDAIKGAGWGTSSFGTFSKTNDELVVDVSDLVGFYYIAINFNSAGSESIGNDFATVHKIWVK